MELIKKLFGRPAEGAGAGESAQFQDSETGPDSASRNAPRRELVQVVLRDSMRRHGIPSDWIECRIVPVLSRNGRTGMHVQLIVRDGVDRLLTYVPAFQTSFMQEIGRFDPRAGDWLLSLSWQFQNLTAAVAPRMPDPAVWAAPVPPATAMGPAGRAGANASADREGDAEVMEDLQALYAIRDAALRPPASARGPAGEQDFEATRPGTDLDPSARSGSSAPRPRSW